MFNGWAELVKIKLQTLSGEERCVITIKPAWEIWEDGSLIDAVPNRVASSIVGIQ